MPTFSKFGSDEGATPSFQLDAVTLSRAAVAVVREPLALGDPDSTQANADIVAVTPVSTSWGLVERLRFSSTAADQPVRAVLSSTTADNPVTMTQGAALWNLGTITTITAASSLALGHLTVDTGNLRVTESASTDLNASLVVTNQSSARPSSGTSGVVVRPVIDAILTVASTNAFGTSTSLAVASSEASSAGHVVAYTIQTTGATPTGVGFYSSNRLLWPMVFGAVSSNVSGAQLACSAPGYLFRGENTKSLTLNTRAATQGIRVGVSYFRAPSGVIQGGGGGGGGPLSVLTAGDFQYLGYYGVQLIGTDSHYGQGFTCRYINGDLRFLWVAPPSFGRTLFEFSLTGLSYGQTRTTYTNHWPNIPGLTSGFYPGVSPAFYGLYWDEAHQRLFFSWSDSYTQTWAPTQLHTCTLNADGTVSNVRGWFGLPGGVSDKITTGAVTPIPTWFQQTYVTGPYLYGYGGYTSLVNQGGYASMGLSLWSIPDPDSISSSSFFPTETVKRLADHKTLGLDWYSDAIRGGADPATLHPTNVDRGYRLTLPDNTVDRVPPPNGLSYWTSPAPDGVNRSPWGDDYWDTGVWIDTPIKTGFVAVYTTLKGTVGYPSNQVQGTLGKGYELHIVNPYTMLGPAALGTKDPALVQPTEMTAFTAVGGALPLPGLVPIPPQYVPDASPQPNNSVVGACFDPVGKRFYVLANSAFYTEVMYVYVYQVNC